MHKPLLFLDMDGVVADFVGHLASRMQIPLDEVLTSHSLEIAFGVPVSDVEPFIREPSFWRNVPPTPWAGYLVKCLNDLYDLYILSRPWDDQSSCLADKVDWCKEHLGIPQDRVILTKHKHLLSRQNAFLVDDYDVNCAAWAKMGGVAIEFPARHNGWKNLNRDGDNFVAWTLFQLERARLLVQEHERNIDRN